jgi:hypothetical protein
MHPHYYINVEGVKEGPHDLVTVMRRIRSGKIDPYTLIYIGEAASPVQAHTIHDLSLFFTHEGGEHAAARMHTPKVLDVVRSAWEFTMEHNIMTVFAGGLLILSLLIALMIGSTLGILTGWCVFVLLQNFFLVFMLRLYRGQTIASDFVNDHLAPMIGMLVVASIILALMTAGGVVLLLIPGVVVAVLYVFVPFLMLDYRYRPVEAMHASRLLLQKNKRSHVGAIAGITLLHLVCVVFVLPIPLTLPMFGAALAQLYEELSAS